MYVLNAALIRGSRLNKRTLIVIGILAALMTGCFYLQRVMAQSDQLVAYGFEEGTGTAIDDTSSNNNDATASNTAWISAGRYGNGLTFNGTSSRVRGNASISLSNTFTLGAWVFNPSEQSYETVMSVGSNRDLYIDGGVPGFWDGSNDYGFGSGMTANAWHYVALVSDGSNVRVYVDGVQQGSTVSLALSSTSGTLQVGAFRNGSGTDVDFFSGTIDEPRVHNRALNTTELAGDAAGAVLPDTTAPTVSVTHPANSSTVSGTVSVNANAADNHLVSGVQFKLDGNNLGAEDTAAPYTVSWNTGNVSNGSHTLTAVTRDPATNQTTSSTVTVTVNNATVDHQSLAYAFDENTSTLVNDASPSNNDGTVASTGWTSSGRYGNVIVFDGSTMRAVAGAQTSLAGDDRGGFTLEAWINNPSNQAYETIMAVGSNRDLHLQSGVPTFYDGTTAYSFGSALSTSTWHHLAFVYDDYLRTVTLYVDGNQYGSVQSTNNLTGAYSDYLQVGAWPTGSGDDDFFSGTIDEVRVYNRKLSANEVAIDLRTAIPTGSDTTAPVVSGGSPVGSLANNGGSSNSTTLEVTTQENATCRYSTTANTAYASMASTFSTTGGIQHSQTLTGLAASTGFDYYVRCIDASSNANSSDYAISFTFNTAGTNVSALRFYGTGSGDADRVKVPLTTNKTIDVDGDFTVEFKMYPVHNSSSATCVPSATDGNAWRTGRTIIDRSIGDGLSDNGGYGISYFAGGVVGFGVQTRNGGATLCSGSLAYIDFSFWTDIAFTRDAQTGEMCVFFHTSRNRCMTGPTGSVGYNDGRSTSFANDPYFVIGAEKHDTGAGNPSFMGRMEELRVSNAVRYHQENYQPGDNEFGVDDDTVALYHFDEGSGTTVGDATTDNDGTRMTTGSSPVVPEWIASPMLPF